MGRTRAERGGGYRKVLAARPPRKVLGSSSLSLTAALPAGKGRCVVGNPVCVRPVPPWQRGIGEFLQQLQKENRAPNGEVAGSNSQGLTARIAQPLPPDPAEDGESSEEQQM
ncbi:PCNA-associated factor [Pezoporus occidentalis]|uniref:PCNA-associated factor n=1 Tax=Pezoporus occidentalis TaxID=407982 RepID=UPI002F91988A